MKTQRELFLEAAQELLVRGPYNRDLGVCFNLAVLLEGNSAGQDVTLNGYVAVAMLSDGYADFKPHHSGEWGPIGSEGCLFRFQWLRDRIALVKDTSDEVFEQWVAEEEA